jgi:RNA polymerase sigma-70 factor (sigma-E family)
VLILQLIASIEVRTTDRGGSMSGSSGDEQEFVDFAHAHGDWLFRTALALTADWHHAQDLTQTALGKILVSWSKVSRADHPRAYARGVLVKAWLSERRKRSSREVPSAAVPEREATNDFVDAIAAIEALRALHPRDRAVLILRFIEDRTVEQTAADLGLSRSAVSTATARALVRAREALGLDGGARHSTRGASNED